MKKLSTFHAGKFFKPIPWKETIAVLFLLLAIFFFRSERNELHAIMPQLQQANSFWIGVSALFTVVCILCQSGMYVQSFRSISLRLKWVHAVELFLKRNFISVFLPAGGISSLAYSPTQLRRQGFNQSQVHQASGIFAFAGLFTVLIAGFPVVLYTVLNKDAFKNAWLGLVAVLLIIVAIVLTIRSFKTKGVLYKWVDKKFPSATPSINELFAANVNSKNLGATISYSLGVELCGMLHVYIAMLALGVVPSFAAAASAYIISILLMIVSPFLRGLGAVELSMAYVLTQFGYTPALALSVTILYRVFEFWLPLVAGFLAFAWKGRKIFFRIAPALLTFSLGLVNIISVVTPPLHMRMHLLREYLPLTAIHASGMLVLFSGLALIVTSAFLVRGLRNAWIIAVLLSVVSALGNISKALDYEEAIAACITIIVLIATFNQYRIRSSNKWMNRGVRIALLMFVAVSIFGFISFYFIDVRHFDVDFSWKQSILHTYRMFLLVEDSSLQPVTRFGNEFIWLIRSLGFATWAFLLFTVIKPVKNAHIVQENQREKAKFLLKQFGNSSIDYFKVYKDKLIFLSDIHDAFIAYRIAAGYAIVLEEPVCAEDYKVEVLREFEVHCRKMGLKPAFYRVDENSMPWFDQLRKNKLIIGQEAILDIRLFSLEGRDKKSLRNGLNSLQKKGYSVNLHSYPHTVGFISELKIVSDEWLSEFDKKETIFSQGMFDAGELQQQDIITVKDEIGNVAAFMNIIPDFAEDDCTYDLIRKTKDAPGAAMDALIVKLVEYAKERGKLYVNLGLVPMTGIGHPENTAEQLIKLAAEKIKRFQHYKGLREFKEKYANVWENKYLVYDNDFDLLQLPVAINTVMKP